MDFRDNPYTTLEELQAEVKRLVEQLRSGAEAFIIKDQDILTTETAVAHGLNFAPQAAILVPHANVAWERSSPSDSKNCYFTVSGECSADIIVFP